MIEAIVLAVLLQAAPGQMPVAPQPDPPPFEGEWIVEILDNIKVMPDSRVTIKIQGATISGSASCNTYRGAFTIGATAGTAKVGQLLRTMKACDPARMSEEGDFFALMDAVTGYEVRPNDTLILRTSAGKTITARRFTPQSVP